LKSLFASLGDYRVTKRLAVAGAPDDVWLVELQNGTKTGWAAWRATDGAQPTTIAVPTTGMINVATVAGATTTQDASIGIAVSPDPVFVTTQ
jgi:hypothetical protein